MTNFSDYIKWRGDLSFSVSPFNDIDALILSQISYLNFDFLIPDGDFSSEITLSDLSFKFRTSPDFETRSDTGALINPLTVQLLFDAAESVRFHDLKVTGYVSKTDSSIEEQFAAMTYLLPEYVNFVSFRGTDDTITGWKEDFNLALNEEVPAQKDAVLYLEKAMKNLRGNFICAGHSKGGNLSVYASSMCCEKLKKRIDKIYNFDGPGFTEAALKSKEFSIMNEKLSSFYPQLSIVGMLFRHEGKSLIVKSSQSGLMQHDPFSWNVEGLSFITCAEFDEASRIFHKSFNQWIDQMSIEQRKLFIETFFEIIGSTEAVTNSEIEENLPVSIIRIIKKLATLDSDVRKAVEEIVRPLLTITHKNLPGFQTILRNSGIGKKASGTVEKVREKIQNK